MSLPGVIEEIIDGTSGVNPAAANEGLVCFVGVAVGGTATAGEPVLLGVNSAARAIVGNGPLAERLEDYFGAGGQNTQAIAIPLAPTVSGVISAVVPIGASAAVLTVGGTPEVAVDGLVEVVKGGDFLTATFKVSVDGGKSWSPVKKTVASASSINMEYMPGVVETGLTLTFTDAAPGPGSFVVGDTFTFTVSEPDVAATDVITPLEAAFLVYSPEFVVIVGQSGQSEWATFSLFADDKWNEHKPVIMVFETALPTSGQTIDQWITAMLSDGELFAHRWCSIVAAYGDISLMDGTKKSRNAVGVMMGMYSRLRVNASVGRYLECGITQLALPKGYNNTHADQLDVAGFVAVMKHAGSKVVHFANGRLKSQAGSDFVYIEDARTMQKATRICRIESLKSLHMDATLEQLEKLKADCSNGMGIMKRAIPPEIHDAIITIPANQDIVNDGLVTDLQVVKYANLRKLRVRLWQTFFNPTV